MLSRIYFPNSLGQKKPGVESTCRYLRSILGKSDPIVEVTTNLSKNLANLYSENMRATKSTINIGGDHSMAIATVAASLQKHGSNLKVIWFDAHGDINTRKSSPSGNFHGMPLAFLTGLDSDFKLFPFLYPVPELKFSNILYLGIRDLDEGEKKVLNDNKMMWVHSSDMNRNTENVISTIKMFAGNDPVHFSFDVDGIDPTEMPCTGTTAKNGVRVDAAKKIVDYIVKKTNLVNMDITELNLELCNDKQREISMQNFLKLFEKYV